MKSHLELRGLRACSLELIKAGIHTSAEKHTVKVELSGLENKAQSLGKYAVFNLKNDFLLLVAHKSVKMTILEP